MKSSLLLLGLWLAVGPVWALSQTEAIPEILELRNGDAIAAELYEHYDSQTIARSLVERLRRNREQENTTGEADYDFYRNTRIILALNYKYFPLVAKNGFLNQHQTGTSAGTLAQHFRAELEDQLIGPALGNAQEDPQSKVNDVRPKYAYVFLDDAPPEMGFSEVIPSYGNVYFKFKDAIKERSTFTPGDTLNTKLEGFALFTPDFAKSFHYRSPKRLRRGSSWFSLYWEAQIWGELTLEDVDYVLVNCPKQEAITRADIRKIKFEGLKVYQCKVEHAPDGKVINLRNGPEL